MPELLARKNGRCMIGSSAYLGTKKRSAAALLWNESVARRKVWLHSFGLPPYEDSIRHLKYLPEFSKGTEDCKKNLRQETDFRKNKIYGAMETNLSVTLKSVILRMLTARNPRPEAVVLAYASLWFLMFALLRKTMEQFLSANLSCFAMFRATIAAILKGFVPSV